LGEIEEVVKKLLEPETGRLKIESVQLVKPPPKGELCTLTDVGIFYPRLNERLVYSHWLREEARENAFVLHNLSHLQQQLLVRVD
jgi:hypothetical protein